MLWSNIDRRFIAWGAAGWHIAFDVLDRFLSGTPIGRIADDAAMKFAGRQRLVIEDAEQFDVKPPNWVQVKSREEVTLNRNRWTRQTHRWLSITFTVTSTSLP